MTAAASIPLSQARRIALAAQGFAMRRTDAVSGVASVRQLFERLHVVQIDSVNVLVRSQELPLFARLGHHRRDSIDRLAAAGELFEYWCHEAAHARIDLYPLFRWKMERARMGAVWNGLAQLAQEQPGYVDAVLDEVRERGPIASGQLSDPGLKQGPWWGWNRGKTALEWLFWTGQVTARRGRNFERVYDLPERMIPASVLARPAPSRDDAHRALLALAVQALGIGSARCISDYFRLKLTDARPLLAELVAGGTVERVAVEGQKEPWYLDAAAAMPRRVRACALLSPFDPVVWERRRAEALFGFEYRIEIYTPAPKRRYGYYVLPFLLGDELVGRVDLKSNRANGALLVQAAWAEPGRDPRHLAPPLMEELRSLSRFLGLGDVVVVGRGDLSPALAQC
jgi:uncharacterized protein